MPEFRREETIKCPHCNVQIYVSWTKLMMGGDSDGYWEIAYSKCPSCNRFIVFLNNGDINISEAVSQTYANTSLDVQKSFLVRPKTTIRSQIPSGVPERISKDYREACLVANDSPAASAALSRRCLRNIMVDNEKIDPALPLSKQIEALLEKRKVPAYLEGMIKAVRKIGKFDEYPLKDVNTCSVVDVEPNEVEWNLDVIEALFDFYYVLPGKAKERVDALNEKLRSSGIVDIRKYENGGTSFMRSTRYILRDDVG